VQSCEETAHARAPNFDRLVLPRGGHGKPEPLAPSLDALVGLIRLLGRLDLLYLLVARLLDGRAGISRPLFEGRLAFAREERTIDLELGLIECAAVVSEELRTEPDQTPKRSGVALLRRPGLGLEIGEDRAQALRLARICAICAAL